MKENISNPWGFIISYDSGCAYHRDYASSCLSCDVNVVLRTKILNRNKLFFSAA